MPGEHFRADLHCHTTCSDGSMTPEELVRHAHEIGLKGISITDHDTVDAYLTAPSLAESLGIKMITGVEFSTSYKEHSVHILGYGIDPNHSSIKALCQKHVTRRRNRSLKILEKLQKLGFDISENDLRPTPSKHEIIGRPHIAQAMLKKGYVQSLKEAFHKYLTEGKPAYVPEKSISVEETIEVIHQGGGVAVIAHPHLIKRQNIIRHLKELNFQGIECYYGNFKMHDNQKWLNIAESKKWLITGGSDFHGIAKPAISLGSSWVGSENFEKLTQAIAKFPKLD